MTNYTEVFGGNVAKTSVFDVPQLVALPETLCLFPIYRVRAVNEHRTVFSAHTENGKLADREEKLSEFDKKCFGLESYAIPLNRKKMNKVGA